MARMRSPEGWVEPGQRPDFDEWTLVLDGTLRVEHETGVIEVLADQAILVSGGEAGRSTRRPTRVAPSTSRSACRPFSPDTVHRDDDGPS